MQADQDSSVFSELAPLLFGELSFRDMNGHQQRIIGFGPQGRTYPHAIVVEAQQPGPDGIDLQLIVDDGYLTDYVRYVAGDQRRRMVKLQNLDPDRALRFADLSLPVGTTEVLIECFDGDNNRIPDLCCNYNLYACTFAAVSLEDEGFHEGVRQEAGVTLKYQKTGIYNEYETAQRLAKEQDKSFIGRAMIALIDLILLCIRCWLGAVFLFNLGFRKVEHCIICALIFGVVSQRTLGNTVKILFGSTALKVSAIFSPVLVAAYFAVNPMKLKEIVYGGGISEELSLWVQRIQWDSHQVVEATQWSILVLLGVWFFLWMFTPDLGEEEE